MISRKNGSFISEREHIQQSITMILTTPVGSRVMRRDFGSHLPRLLGKPLNPQTVTAIYAATHEALSIYEPRIEVVQTRMDLEQAKEGVVSLSIVYRFRGEERTFGITFP